MIPTFRIYQNKEKTLELSVNDFKRIFITLSVPNSLKVINSDPIFKKELVNLVGKVNELSR